MEALIESGCMEAAAVAESNRYDPAVEECITVAEALDAIYMCNE